MDSCMDLDLEQCLDFLKALNGVLNLVLECTLEYSVPGDFDSESVPGDFARRRASGSRRSSSRAGRRRWVGGCCSTSGRARRGGAGTSTFSTCRMVEREKRRQWPCVAHVPSKAHQLITPVDFLSSHPWCNGSAATCRRQVCVA